jgi:hypothetical protein
VTLICHSVRSHTWISMLNMNISLTWNLFRYSCLLCSHLEYPNVFPKLRFHQQAERVGNNAVYCGGSSNG